MDIGILYYKPDEYTKNTFEHIYRTLTIEEYGELSQTGIYGQYNTENAAIEFMIYKGKENKIGIVFKNIVVRNGKFEDEIKMICINSSGKDYLNDYTHFMIISQSSRFIKILETGGKTLKPGMDFKYIQESTLLPSKKLIILLQQNDFIKCTTIENNYGRGRVIKIKKWENGHSEDTEENIQNDKDGHFEKGKQLPSLFGDEIKKYKIESILKEYFKEQECEYKRERINYTIYGRKCSQHNNLEKRL